MVDSKKINTIKPVRLQLICAALTGLLADHLDHSTEVKGQETCADAVARLACEHADAIIRRLYIKEE